MLRGLRLSGLLLIACLALVPGTALAHQKWFVDPDRYPLETSAILSWRTALGLGLALAAVLTALLIDRAVRRSRLPGELSSRLEDAESRIVRLYDWVPLVLGLHVAVPLLVTGVQLEFLAPNLKMERNGLGAALALGQIVVALSFLYGALTRYGAMLLIGLIFVGGLVFGLEDVIEHVVYVGIALFFYILGRGPFSVDGLLKINARRDMSLTRWAIPALRIGMGASIMALGFTEKLWNLPMGLAFLQAYPLNFFPAIGMPFVTDEIFVLLAGVVEVTAGLLLISGLLLRLAILGLWLPFNLTLPLLGWQELVGHLPIYGIMVVLLIFGTEYGYSVRSGISALARGRRVEVVR